MMTGTAPRGGRGLAVGCKVFKKISSILWLKIYSED